MRRPSGRTRRMQECTKAHDLGYFLRVTLQMHYEYQINAVLRELNVNNYATRHRQHARDALASQTTFSAAQE